MSFLTRVAYRSVHRGVGRYIVIEHKWWETILVAALSLSLIAGCVYFALAWAP